MCGIFCKLVQKQYSHENYDSGCHVNNEILKLLKCRGPDVDDSSSYHEIENISVYMFGATLWMQGIEPSKQPLENECGILLFNGDIYNKQYYDNNQNDTQQIFKQLTQNDSYIADITTIKSIVGPFSLIYLNKKINKLYFSRDKYGRKSLLCSKNQNEIIISSVMDKSYSEACELPANGIYCLGLSNFTLTKHLWNDNNLETNDIVKIANFNNLLQINENIDSGCNSYEITNEISSLYEEVETLSSQLKCRKSFLHKLLTMDFFSTRVKQLIDLLSESVKVRVRTQPPFCKKCIESKTKCENHCTVGILFSGGLDCTILAALAHNHIPLNEEIDLLNVAFEHKNCDNYQVPDRITSIESLKELQRLYPERKWNLLKIDITSDELRKQQIEIISNLIYPLRTILDESLGSALWFAARGKVENYESTSRVILMGMGADELFGGYTRHRNAFKRGGWTMLGNELELDWKRLPSRNLARDDRIVSHHGRQPRTPYLDENFLNYVLQLKPWERCFPSQSCEVGVGDKLLLRLVAMKIGLECTSVFPKRAIQFGSKIANKSENAKDISPRLIR